VTRARERTHTYIDDGERDWRGESRCQECGTPRRNKHHLLPDTTAADNEYQRRAGESEDSHG
jgi:hypothetical protein